VILQIVFKPKKGGFMRRGFTLIEMVIVIAIISIVGGTSVVSFKYYKTITNKADAQYYCNAIVNFINNSKMYCRENSCSGIVTFDIENNNMKLEDGISEVEELIFTDKIKLYEVIGRRSNRDIVIDKRGSTNDACTIMLIDNNSIKHKITVRVGTEYVKIIM
jgi:prepilin-type N-terminal cleavage/methylation domain-containing protein